MDLRNGVLEINGTAITPQTSQIEFEAVFSSELFSAFTSPKHPDKSLYTAEKPVICGDMKARVEVLFQNAIINEVEIICADEELRLLISSWNEKYEQRLAMHKEWLSEQLGEPTSQTKYSTIYSFDWGQISVEDNRRDLSSSIVMRLKD